MNEPENLRTEEEITELVAEALCQMGFSGGSQDTGGGICCVVLGRKDGGEIVWGTADVNWGASVINEEGEVTSSLETQCPSGTQDILQVAEAIKGPSIAAGATYEQKN